MPKALVSLVLKGILRNCGKRVLLKGSKCEIYSIIRYFQVVKYFIHAVVRFMSVAVDKEAFSYSPRLPQAEAWPKMNRKRTAAL
jgi:hypothetical protein